MKKIITISIVTIFLSIFSLHFVANRVEAQIDDTCPSIAPYRCMNGSCTNEASICDQSWGGGLNTDPGGTSGGGVVNPSTPPAANGSSFGKQCTGNIRYSEAEAKACADLAEAQGKALGYNIDCSVETRVEQLSLNSSLTGETVPAYYGACTVNGVSGFYDIDLVGYTGTGAPIQRYPGKTGYDANDYIFGSNYQRSAGWNILPCDLANTAAGTSGVLAGATGGQVSCSVGASNYFGTSNPSSWSPKTATTINKPPVNIVSGVGGVAGGAGMNLGGTGIKTSTGTGIQSFLAQIQNLMNKIIADYKKINSNFTYTPPNTLPNTTTPNTNDPNYYALGNLTTDKSSYCVGETPKYTLTGGPGLAGYKVLWTSYFNNVITNEVDADYGFKMSTQGSGSSWTDYGWTWNSGHIGSWKKQANVGGTLKTVNFDVKACSTPANTVSCSPKSTVWFNTFSVIPNLSATGGSGTYSWTATGSTKVSGAGTLFSTSYSQNGKYSITVSDGVSTDTCEVIISPSVPIAMNR